MLLAFFVCVGLTILWVALTYTIRSSRITKLETEVKGLKTRISNLETISCEVK